MKQIKTYSSSRLSRVLFGLVMAFGLSLASATKALANTTIIEVHLGGVGQPDLQFLNGVLQTVNDGNASTPGDQDTDILYESLLNFLPDIISGASFTLAGVTVSGAPVTLGPDIIQGTVGGTFSLYGNDPGHTLLLSGILGNGQIIGTDTGSVGSFFNTQVGMFTGGSLLPFLPVNLNFLMGFSLGSVNSSSGPGMDILNGPGGAYLGNFSANGTGLIDVVPEPASLSLLALGLFGGLGARRRGCNS